MDQDLNWCRGTVHVYPVPPAMTPEEAWEEIKLAGHLRPYNGEPSWATYLCPGFENCECYGGKEHWDFRWHKTVGGSRRLIEARIFRRKVPSLFLPIVALLDKLSNRAGYIPPDVD